MHTVSAANVCSLFPATFGCAVSSRSPHGLKASAHAKRHRQGTTTTACQKANHTHLEAGVLPDAEGVGSVFADVLLAVDMLWALQRCRLGHALQRKRPLAVVLDNLADAAEGTLAQQVALLQHQRVAAACGAACSSKSQ